MSSPQVWFITGASSGFGRHMTELVLERGDIAVATLRKPQMLHDLVAKYSSDNLLVVELDVRNRDDIIRAFNEAQNKFGRVDVVFNNAGYGVLGEVESTDDSTARELFEVNFWAAANVSREAVRVFREVNKPAGGRLLQNTSIAAVTGRPGLGYYSASKSALEGLSESLAAELDPEWHIKITIIQPGGFQTEVVRSMPRTPVHPAYATSNSSVIAVREYFDNDPITANVRRGVEVIYDVAQLLDSPFYFPLGKDCIGVAKDKVARMALEIEKYESWSDNLDAE